MSSESLAVSQADFAVRMNWKRSYVSQLKADGRLVLDDAGRVLVDASIARINATADPSKAPVAERHAAGRGDAPAPDESKVGASYQASRAVRERFLALAAKRDYDLSMGNLVDASEVRHAIAGAVTTFRGRLEVLPEILAAEVAAEQDEGKVRRIIADALEDALGNLAREFSQLAKVEA